MGAPMRARTCARACLVYPLAAIQPQSIFNWADAGKTGHRYTWQTHMIELGQRGLHVLQRSRVARVHRQRVAV